MSGAQTIESSVGATRVRVSAPDPFAGLRGKEYLAARGLLNGVSFKGQSPITGDCECPTCVRERLLPAVLRICAAQAQRQQELASV